MIRFTFLELVLMTANFGTKIEERGFGIVFKGHIGSNTTVVVVLLSQVEKEFIKEVDNIGQIHHIHLVLLLGYYAKVHYKLLIYEYMERGSVDKILFQGKEKLGLLVLEWWTKFAIAIKTAKGLAYLYDDNNEQIIHYNVKSKNILLDSTLNAKVADFGLSHILKCNQTQIVTIYFQGTCGYLYPEWMLDGLSITNKVDVQSNGMVLLEIINGRCNLMVLASKEDALDMYLSTWTFSKIETESFMDVVDTMLTEFVNLGKVRPMLHMAFWCINSNPQVLPMISEVVQMLLGQVPINMSVSKSMVVDDLKIVFDDSKYSTLHSSTLSTSTISIEETHGFALLTTTSGQSLLCDEV